MAKKISSAETAATPMITSSTPPFTNRPNATPRLWTWTSWTPGKMPSLLPIRTLWRTSDLVTWSAATTATASAAARRADLPEIKTLG